MSNENWQAVIYSGPYDAARVWSDQGQIALVNSQDGRAHEHYARLMAAAPDLLEALESALGSLEYAAMVLEVPEKSTFRENIAGAKAAIAKAKGV